MPKHAAARKVSSSFKTTLIIVLALILLIAGVAGYILLNQWKADLGPLSLSEVEPQIFVVEKGWTLTRIANELETAGMIKSARSFINYGKQENTVEKLQAGQYLLSPHMSVPEMMDALVSGKIVTKTFTIPEGYNLRQIAQVLVKAGFTTEEEFWQAVREGDYAYDFLADLPKDEKRLEGYLFPDTYIIPDGMPIEKILDVMLRRFVEVYGQIGENKSGLNMHQLVTLASIVENEAKLDEERPYVASVFLNRLKNNWKLESCATIQYHYDVKKERLLYSDLEIDSPYNTYKHQGLPPGPISSPGKASLEAVAQALESDYFFFVAKEDGSGGHVFSSSLSEHNKAKWLIRH